MPVDVLRVGDRVAGNALERWTNAHHARRLGKLGRSAQRTPPDDRRPWAAGDPPPRAGNALEVLIEGAAYFPALEQAIRSARRSVFIAGWCITPGFALVRDEPPVLLRELLGEAAESVDVRVLLWAGAPVPVFAPRRASVREGRDELVRGTRIRVALDSNERATVAFVFTKNAPGRNVQHRCVAPTQHNRHRPRCTRTVAAGTLTFTARRGPNKVRFDGRISTTKKLRPGRYRLVITATDTADGQQSASGSLSFTIVR